MKSKFHLFVFAGIMFTVMIFFLASCNLTGQKQQTSDSGVKKATTKVSTNAAGHTGEQENIIKRTQRDNDLGAIKYLYQVSAYTGKVMFMSTVKGKVTSGGKRLSPTTVRSYEGIGTTAEASYVIINGRTYFTDEVPDENGTYGSSMPYLYWFDQNDSYQQLYISGGTTVHISDHPIRIREQVLQLEMQE